MQYFAPTTCEDVKMKQFTGKLQGPYRKAGCLTATEQDGDELEKDCRQ